MPLVPAQAGAQPLRQALLPKNWIPAYAEMSGMGGRPANIALWRSGEIFHRPITALA
jgi:hypothetical protein